MNISVITCTYNPEEKVLSQVLQAVRLLTIPDNCNVEYIIIDNNSSTLLSEAGYVKDFLESVSWAKVIVESKQGLSHARLRGFTESKGDIIVFFDDDNIAHPDYLVEVKQLFENHVQVGIWGPGDIDVVFTDPVDDWVKGNTLGLFQQKKNKAIEFGYSLNSSSFHPFGTGMALRRQIVEFYYKEINDNGFTITGRKGNSLASADDTQMLYAAYKMGLATGVSPALKMKHLIPGKRTTMNYICKLLYGSYSTGDTALVESFPEFRSDIVIPNDKAVIKKLIKKTVSIATIKDQKRYKMDISAYIGTVAGKYKALDLDKPEWLNKVISFLKLES